MNHVLDTMKIPSTKALDLYAQQLGIKHIYHKQDDKTGLNAIIVIHNTDKGPAIGGTRFQPYTHQHFAIKDGIQLAHRMAYKSAAMGLPHGGAKAVINMPKQPFDRQALFEAMGKFVEEVNGDYIASLDAGTIAEDMDAMLKNTDYVIGSTPGHLHAMDPSIYTAYGVFKAMQAALEVKQNTHSFANKTISIQGAGHVASHLINYLLQEGAQINVCDIDSARLTPFLDNPQIKIVNPDDIFTLHCDIFTPCALGGIINITNLKLLNTKFIIGAANNQLAHKDIAHQIADLGITYLPDFIVNAGGVIGASCCYRGLTVEDTYAATDRIYDLSKQILETAKTTNQLPNTIAIQLAEHNMQN